MALLLILLIINIIVIININIIFRAADRLIFLITISREINIFNRG